MKRFWIIILTAGIVIIAMSAYQYASRPKTGDIAPQFELISIDGKGFSLNQLRGRPVIVHFWATWCGVCQKEFPSLERFYKSYGESGLVLLAISEDGRNGVGEVRTFLNYFPSTFPILIDPEGRVADSYQSYGVPETFFIDREGVIVERVNNAINWDDKEVRSLVRSLIDKH